MFSEKPESISLTPGELYIKLVMVWQSPELAPIWHLANLLNTPAERPRIVSGKRLTAAEIQLVPSGLFHLLKYTENR